MLIVKKQRVTVAVNRTMTPLQQHPAPDFPRQSPASRPSAIGHRCRNLTQFFLHHADQNWRRRKSLGHAQKFLATHDKITTLFRPKRRHLSVRSFCYAKTQ
ncbi:hypothetical protein Acry_1035 [Acidiphilium cryptum JF-5]|uniref:Uncharacterized protein n=1 Tax=Acidiphilium cryptum (strain JF-5) TaxID=349163 RepID=A5FXB9_ACICJ|nr:hypothetical protein Acry_1035 [Acidiphilium cryptum JF-5]